MAYDVIRNEQTPFINKGSAFSSLANLCRLGEKNKNNKANDIEQGKDDIVTMLEEDNNTNNPTLSQARAPKEENVKENVKESVKESDRTVHTQTPPMSMLNKKGKKFVVELIHFYTHFMLLVIFEMLFYFHFIVQYEKKLLYVMIIDVIQDSAKLLKINIIHFFENSYYDELCTRFVAGRTNEGNVEIYNNALYVIFGMLAFLIFLMILETKVFVYGTTFLKTSIRKATFPRAFCKAILLMTCVGMFDYIFFKVFILKYKVIDTTELMCYLYDHYHKT